MDSGQNPVKPLLLGLFGWTRNHLCWPELHRQLESQKVNVSFKWEGLAEIFHT